jgi:integrase
MPKRRTGEVFKRGKIYAIRYYDARGRRRIESSGSERQDDAEKMLRQRLKAVDDHIPLDMQIGKVKFDDAAQDVINEYQMNGRKSLGELRRRIAKHLKPYFGGRKLVAITTSEITDYVVKRQQAIIVTGKGANRRERPVSNAEINRELAVLKRIFVLAIQGRKVLHKPHIPMLRENNTRTGFFEFEQFQAVRAHLPEDVQPIITFAYITGWRIASEVLPLQWRHIDFKSGEVRLDAGTTKNGDGRVFKMTDDLRMLLDERQHATKELERKSGAIIPWVFYRTVATERGDAKEAKPIRTFKKAWSEACIAAGCPGRIPHDLRRTAVRNMVRAGVPERVAMRLTGHKTRSVFERYNIVSDGDLDVAAVRLNGLIGSPMGSGMGSGTGSASLSTDRRNVAFSQNR